MTWTMPTRISPSVVTALQDRANARYGVLRRDELLDLGVTPAGMARCLNARRWQELGDVIVLHNTVLTEVQRQMVATSSGVFPCALAARTAARAAGLAGWTPPALEVVVPRGTTYPELPFSVRVHESRRFGVEDVAAGFPPRVRIERAVIDGGAWTRWPRTAAGLVAAAVQQRLTTAARLLECLDGAGKIRHRQLMRSALLDIEGGAHAVSEIDFLRFCRLHGFPRPLLQARIVTGGRRRYLDATFKRRDGRLVRVEIDGALDLVVQTYWSDMSRGNELTIDGERVLRFPSYVIYADDPAAVDQLRRAVGLSGRPRSNMSAAS